MFRVRRIAVLTAAVVRQAPTAERSTPIPVARSTYTSPMVAQRWLECRCNDRLAAARASGGTLPSQQAESAEIRLIRIIGSSVMHAPALADTNHPGASREASSADLFPRLADRDFPG